MIIAQSEFGKIRIELVVARGWSVLFYQTVFFLDGKPQGGRGYDDNLDRAVAKYTAFVAKMRKHYDRNPNYPDKREPGTA